MALNTHTYDPYYRDVFETKILPNLPTLSHYEIDNEWIEILENSKKYTQDIQHLSFFVYKLNDIDTNLTKNGYDCHRLGAQVWKIIKHNNDAKNLFMEQFKDMSTGYCAQGQTNRYLQIYNAFIPPPHQ